ncbi:MAG: murein hydrolase activator EnvC family protein [Phenylobacterium sp.]|uniref:murein hydrolase activator EnvC family protein n=1 Tax=Phenylobacterium sp. TaxID=1871053 RepID=UPI00391905DD
MPARRSPALPLALALIIAAGAGVAALAQTGLAQKLADLNLRETSLNAEQGRNLNRIARLLSVLVQMRRDPPPALLVSPDDAKDAVRAAILVKAITPELQRRARAYAAEAVEIARQRRLAAVASETVFMADSEEADHDLELIPEGVPAPPPRSEAFTGALIPPSELRPPVNGPVVQPFGAQAVGGGRTSGLTYQAPPGSAVRAPGPGQIQYVGPVKGWGVILILRMAGGYHLVLAGLDRSSAQVGQSVAAGATVGWMPDGRQSASELYFEVRQRGEPVDPRRWMRANTE